MVGPGLDAKLAFSEEGWQAEFLATFLAKIGPAWRGWVGEYVWQSAEAELRLVATHNGTNTVLLAVRLAEGGPAGWQVYVELDFDPGGLDTLAADAKRLSEPALTL